MAFEHIRFISSFEHKEAGDLDFELEFLNSGKIDGFIFSQKEIKSRLTSTNPDLQETFFKETPVSVDSLQNII